MPGAKLPLFALVAHASLLASCASAPVIERDASRPQRPVMIATWPFGKLAVDAAAESLAAGESGLDGIEAGIRLIESLGSDGTVGLAGRPNAAGYPQLDACIMDGPSRGAGSVAGLEGIVHPITAARRVMDSSRHVMLVGEGARWFALEHGLETIDVSDLDAKKTAWVERELDPEEPAEKGHDTIALLILDGGGDLYGGCSTSGAGGKLPGRVGDSPILGAGLFVDNEVGAAGATGVGENVMRYSATAVIVEMMRQGMTPKEACEAMIHRIAAVDPLGYELDVCFIAMDKQGRWGAAASNQRFPFAVAEAGRSHVVHVDAVPRR
jgi:isoaspartyl peptidase/L-asparaginase-like protein (Ntn-hydrolase superfamily)